MAYNDTPQEFINSLTIENCPPKWIEEAKRFKDNLELVPEDQRRVYRHILQNILQETKEDKVVGVKMEEIEEEEIEEEEEEAEEEIEEEEVEEE